MEEGSAARTSVPLEAGEVKSAVRTLQVLEMIASAAHPLTLSEIATALSLPVSSVHQLLRTLVGRGWLAHSETGNVYSVGVRALFLGLNVLEHDPIVSAVKPQLAYLQAQLGETIHLARLDDARVVYLVSRESEHQLRTVSRAGQSLPAHATALGKAALSTLGDSDVRARLTEPLARPTDRTLGTIDAVIADLAQTRARGWAIEREENTLSTGCIAVPIPTRHGTYAISCSMPLSRLSDERIVEVAGALQRTAQTVETAVNP